MKIKNGISIVQSGEFPLALNTAVDFLEKIWAREAAGRLIVCCGTGDIYRFHYNDDTSTVLAVNIP